jgi:hypothetical protein
MARYRWLQDGVGPSGHYFNAGDIATTVDADPAGLLPANWVPSVNCEPLDAAAVAAYYALGPHPLGLIRQQWSGVPVSPPVTYWVATPGTNPALWRLTGLGANLPPIGM